MISSPEMLKLIEFSKLSVLGNAMINLNEILKIHRKILKSEKHNTLVSIGNTPAPPVITLRGWENTPALRVITLRWKNFQLCELLLRATREGSTSHHSPGAEEHFYSASFFPGWKNTSTPGVITLRG